LTVARVSTKRLVKAAAGEVVGGKISANFLRVSIAYIMVYSMHATIYGRGQMVIPAKARKEAGIDTGDVVNVLPEGDGRLVLVRMERPKPRTHNKLRVIRRKGKHSLLSIGRTISREEVFKALEQFPP
jgi:AbrB family looped-hinge helix DNA binding protein